MGILRYTVYRLIQAVPVLFGLSVITFLLANSMPGDPVSIMLAETESDPELVAALEAQYGLDRPLHERYVNYMIGLAQGDLGYSLYYNEPVLTKVAERLPVTIMLVASSFVFAIATAIPLGVIAAKNRNQPSDHASRIVALIGVSTPSFWIGLMLIIIFAYQLGLLPSSGMVYPWHSPDDYRFIDSYLGIGSTQVGGITLPWLEGLYYETARHLILPTLALGTLHMATIMRIERRQ